MQKIVLYCRFGKNILHINVKEPGLGIFLFFFLTLCIVPECSSQEYWKHLADRRATLGLEDGVDTFRTQAFLLKLARNSQTVAGLSPLSDPNFDYTPSDRLHIRDKDSLYHLGDINLRLRKGDGAWETYSTAYTRKKVNPLPAQTPVLAAADLSPTLPENFPLKISRRYLEDGPDLILSFTLENPTSQSIEIGALGIPMIFNNILEGKSLDEAHAQNVFYDPYMGMDAGYLEVKRLHGKSPGLLVLPEENMPFENYRPLLDDPSIRSVVFEGFHEWMGYSSAYAQSEWQGVQQWNPPHSIDLGPGEAKVFSLRLVLNPSIRKTSEVLNTRSKPTVVSVPGYILPMETESFLWLRHNHSLKEFRVSPEQALRVNVDTSGVLNGTVTKLKVVPGQWGNARLELRYEDGTLQTVHYKVIKKESEVVADYGRFLTSSQWFDQQDDPFGRAPSVITYDIEKREQVTQDARAWIAGLSDEGGAGSWLGAIMKQWINPNTDEIGKLESFMHQTLWGGIQYTADSLKYGVRKSLFYYEPDTMPQGTYDQTINYDTWAAWSKEHANSVGRSYNYPHVAAAHWVFYRLSRFYTDLIRKESWDWYLNNAYRTALAMTELAPHYAQFGQMEGTVFLLILEDLKREGWTEEARKLETEMRERALHWRSLTYPFGSEMPWDSTGQEEVYMWSDYFGFDEKAAITLQAILAYMPALPHWAYNGNARRYWDFVYGGKLKRIERQIHHYGSGLNAIPVLKAYRDDPEDFHLLKIGYGGTLGAISNITQEGFAPAAFHSFPSTLDIDGISGDYGSGFFGYALNSATYIMQHPELGWLSFGGILEQNGGILSITPTTAGRKRIHLAPEELFVEIEAGFIAKLTYTPGSNVLELELDKGGPHNSYAYLRFNKPVRMAGDLSGGWYKISLNPENKTKVRISLP